MDNETLSIHYKKREYLSKEERLYNYASSVIIFTIGIFSLIKGFKNQWTYYVLILCGLIFLIQNYFGKKWYFTKHSIQISRNWIKIETDRFNRIIIDLNAVRQISILTSGLKVAYSDAVKFVDLSWLENDQYLTLKSKLLELSKLHDFKIH